jgi:ABC-type transporter Mla MlaB component
MPGTDDFFGVRKIALPGSLDIAIVARVATEIQDALRLGGLAFDAGAITRLDAAGLQLLCAAVAAARSQGVPVDWVDVPRALADGARTLALTEALALPPSGSQENR